VEVFAERPGDDPGNHGREDDVDEVIVDVVTTAQEVLRSQIEDAVSPQRRGGSVVQVEEPDRAVDERNPKAQPMPCPALGWPIKSRAWP